MNKRIKKISKTKMINFFTKNYRLYILLMIFISLFIGFLNMINISLIYSIISYSIINTEPSANVIQKYNDLLITIIPINDKLISLCIIFIFILLLIFLFKFIELYMYTHLIARVIIENRGRVFQKFINSDYKFFLNHKQGDLIYRVGEAPSDIMVIFSSLSQLFSNAFIIIFILAAMILVNWQSSLIMIFIGILYLILSRKIGYKRLYDYSTKRQYASKEYTVSINESISGIRTIKINGFQEYWIKRAKDFIKENYFYYQKAQLWKGFPSILMNFVILSAIGIITIIIRINYPNQFLTLLPTLGAYVYAIMKLIPSISVIGDNVMKFLEAIPQVELIYNTLHEKTNFIINGNKNIKKLKDKIELKNISFQHEERSILLKNISLIIKKGTITALVGKSGCGKSTIVHLLMRLYDPSEGNIIVDNIDLKEYSLESWLQRIGFVDQDIFMYNSTIYDNIVFGINNYSFEKVVNATKAAYIHDFIEQLPQKYNTIVGDRGIKLSGGEKQRIAIARAVLRNPDILIFDEATASLDNKSEKMVQLAIDDLSKDRTTIVIAHRLSTIHNADNIVVINNGNIVESGTHMDLMAKKGEYFHLYNLQYHKKLKNNKKN